MFVTYDERCELKIKISTILKKYTRKGAIDNIVNLIVETKEDAYQDGYTEGYSERENEEDF